MKTKNKVTFEENRLLGKTSDAAPKAASETPEKSPEDLAVEFLHALNDKLKDTDGLEGGDNPESILENNPYKKNLLDLASGLTEDEDLDFTEVDKKDGKLILHYPEGSADLVIEGKEYVAIFWKEISDTLIVLFEGKNISQDLINLAGERGGKNFEKLILEIAKQNVSTNVSKELVKQTVAELEKLRPALNVEGAKERVKAQGEVEREQLKREEKLPEVPRKIVMERDEFIKTVNSGDEEQALNPIKIAVKRENYQINANNWDHTSKNGLSKIYLDCQRVLGNKKINSPFYQTLFATLANAADATKNKYLAETGEDYLSWFKDPIKYQSQLIALPADRNFWGGEQFVKAYRHLHYLKVEVLNSQDVAHMATLAKQEGLDSDPVATKVTDFLKDNLSKFQKAIKERDYATAGLYATGIWAMYKAFQKLSGGGGHGGGHGNGNMSKWLLYGAAAYAGNHFLKNAGYDVLKMAGFKDKDFEVKDTPFEVMKKFVGEKPEFKDFDYSVPFRMSEVKLTSLNKLLDETNTKGDFFIHPYEFPDLFPDVAKAWPFEMGLGEKGLDDAKGMSNTKLSPSQREYIRLGKQLYLTAVAMKEIYNKTLYKDHPDFKGIPYEVAIQDPVTGMGKIRHLLWAARKYSPEDATRFFSEKTTEKATEHLTKIFAGKDSDLIVEEILGRGHYSGYLRAFPVVFVRDKDSYSVYLRNEYNGLKSPGVRVAAKIPLEGEAGSGMADRALEAVDLRMSELMQPLDLAGGRVLSKPEYSDGGWQTTVKLPGSSEFNVQDIERKGILKVREDGKGVTFLVPGTPVRVNIDRDIENQYEASLAVLPKITSQPEFHALKVFDNARRLKIEDPVPGDGKLLLLIGKGKHKLELDFDKAADKFNTVSGANLSTLIQSPAFRKDYIEALNADELFELNKTVTELKELIKQSCPEKFLVFFFQALANQTLRGPLSGLNTDALSGTIPDNFTNMILDTKKQEAFHKLYRSMEGASSFEDMETLRKDVLSDLNTELTVLYDDISRDNRALVTAGEEWQRMEFMLKVVDKVRNAGAKSTQYSLARVDLEYAAYNMDLPGLATKSELNEASHSAVGKLVNVFTFHAAHLDTADLDNLTYPPAPDPNFTGNPHEDPQLKGHYILNYFEYIKDRIVNEAPKITGGKALSPNLVPDPSDPRWKIKSFEEWRDSEGRYDALDPLDNKPAFEHDENDHIDAAPQHTELDKEFKRRILEAKAMLESHCGTDLNIIELEKYLDNQSGVVEEIGLFNIYKDPTTSAINSKIWEDTNAIAKTAGDRRSVQVKLMNKRVNEFLDFIFNAKDPNSGKLRFFIEEPGVWERIKKYYYKVKYKFNIPFVSP